MKTAISLPDDLFRDAERYAKRSKKSRSQVFGEAMSEYLARRSPDVVTDTLDAVLRDVGVGADRFLSKAAGKVLRQDEW